VIVPFAVYRKMLHHALVAAPPDLSRSSWKESGGFLLGKWLPGGDVLLTDLVSVSSGSSVFVNVTDPQAMQSIPWDRVTAGEPIVGWWHTHPGLRIFMSTTDQKTQITYQLQNPNTVALVMDPAEVTTENPGMRGFQVIDGSKLKTIEIPLNFEGTIDFDEVKKEVIQELIALRVPKIPIMEPAIIENEYLLLQIPQAVAVGQEFSFTVSLKSKEEPKMGVTQVQYYLELSNVVLHSRLLSPILYHEVDDTGLLAKIRLAASSPGTARVSLSGILLQNEVGEEVILNPMEHTLSVVEV
jgi:proteasome lid subunit RPN8/RPN11